MEENRIKKKLNVFLIYILWLYISRHIIRIFQLLFSLFYNDIPYVLFGVIQSIIIITILCNMLRVKRWALYGFFIFQLLNAAVLSLFDKSNYVYALGEHLVTSLILAIIMSVILMLRKNGISGWECFLKNKVVDIKSLNRDYADKIANDINSIITFNVGDTYAILNPINYSTEYVIIQKIRGNVLTIISENTKRVQIDKNELLTLVYREKAKRYLKKSKTDDYREKKMLEDGRVICVIASNDTEVAFDILDREGNLVDSDAMPKEEYDALPNYEEIPEEELDDDGLPIHPSCADNMLIKCLENEITMPEEDRKPVIPVDEEGNPQYHKMPIERTIEDLSSPIVEDGKVYEFTEEEVDGLITANRDEVVRIKERLLNNPPKIGTNKAKYFAEKSLWTNQIADMQARINYWDKVLNFRVSMRK